MLTDVIEHPFVFANENYLVKIRIIIISNGVLVIICEGN
jgi:hypothetical protein